MSDFLAIKPVLVLGSAIGEVDLGQQRQIGGSAFNVARALSRLQVPVVNGMPVGNGEWGMMIEAAMNALGLPVLLRHGQKDNGHRLTQLEPSGKRTLVKVPGCETQWNKAQLAMLPMTPETLIYIHGDELTGESGEALRDWLTRLPFDQWRLIDPGPRVGLLDADFFAMLSDSDTVLTLNRSETATLCGEGEAVTAAQRFAAAHNITLICRLEAEGAWLCDGRNPPLNLAEYRVPVVDTLGAGDAHCAGLLAGISAGWPLPQAVNLANRVAACVVASPGAAGAPGWQQLQQRFPGN
ncbi:ribokinase [Serratia inhibens]|uniref:Ribokinase n=1 Tax=Serratia inhibens TaxID=2338073 RepID=A0AA92X4I6_9GAMM|nr:PfkB family carbohydrate kinase [Serratia inhibens]RJF54133.1 ribokinase [Serratia inhibens]